MPSSPEQLRQRAADLRQRAADLSTAACHADGQAYYNLMYVAERLEARAREIERSTRAVA